MSRPTKYNKAIADKLPDLFGEGQSIIEVCGELKISRDTFYNWKKQYPEFSKAVDDGLTLSQAFWEKLGREGTLCKRNVQPTMYIFQMKNRFHWTDRADLSMNGGILIQKIDSDDEAAL
ncbi:transposase [Treponema primitia]|uniref:transposase n=1 Tax=Treponema primitia TaxID=88058 RepID=UPI0002554FD5|nr:transposase [Treponema primitia]